MNLQYHCALENAVRAGPPEHPTPHTFYPRMQSIFGFWRQWSELRVAFRSILRIEVRDFKLPSYGSFLLVIKKKTDYLPSADHCTSIIALLWPSSMAKFSHSPYVFHSTS